MLDQPILGHLKDRDSYPRVPSGYTDGSKRSGLPVGRMIMAASIVVLVGGAAFPLLPRYYTSYSEVIIRPIDPQGGAVFTQTSREALDDNAIQTKMNILVSLPLQRMVAAAANLVQDEEFNHEITPSFAHKLITRARSYLSLSTNLRDEREIIDENLKRRLKVGRDKRSYVIDVGYELKNPEKAAALTNILVNAFIADDLKRKEQMHAGLLGRLHLLTEKSQLDYATTEATEHAFLVTSGLIHKSETESLGQQLATISTALANAHVRTVETANRAQMLINAERTGTMDNVNETLTTPILDGVRRKLFDFVTAPSAGNADMIINLKKIITTEMEHHVRAAQSDAQVAATTEAGLRSEIARIDARLTALQDAQRIWESQYQPRVVAARTAWADAMTRENAAIGKDAVQAPDITIASPAVPPIQPSFPNPLIYAGGLLVLAFGTGILPLVSKTMFGRIAGHRLQKEPELRAGT